MVRLRPRECGKPSDVPAVRLQLAVERSRCVSQGISELGVCPVQQANAYTPPWLLKRSL